MVSSTLAILVICLWTHTSLSISLLNCSTQNWPQCSRRGLTKAEYSCNITATSTIFLLMELRIAFAFLATASYRQLMFSYRSTETRSFNFYHCSGKLPQLYVCFRFFLPRLKTLSVLMLKWIWFAFHPIKITMDPIPVLWSCRVVITWADQVYLLWFFLLEVPLYQIVPVGWPKWFRNVAELPLWPVLCHHITVITLCLLQPTYNINPTAAAPGQEPGPICNARQHHLEQQLFPTPIFKMYTLQWLTDILHSNYTCSPV